MSLSLLEVAIAAFVVLTALATAAFRDVLSAVIVFAAYSLGMAVFYTVLRAPDVALTEAAIGAGLTTVLLILAITRTARPAGERRFESVNWPAAAVTVAFVGVVGWTVLALPPVGSPDAIVWSNPAVTGHYLAEAYHETGVENAVTAVLAAYRGFDTFGEAVVVFAVGVAVVLVLNREVFA
ncbi:MAG: DUF4040 domain-containing protein [Halobacteriales archaeon]